MKKTDPAGGAIVGALVILLLIAILGFVGNIDVAEEYMRGAQEKVMRPKRVMQATKDQILKDCPKFNKKKQPLRFQHATKKFDADAWILHCEYGPAVLTADNL